jgi:NAD(P)-dependent dehydrogenase (short-subunit alcohol dehydrogenase family)
VIASLDPGNGRNHTFIKTDVSVPSEVVDAFERIDAELGGTDVLVNSAGIREISKLLDLSLEEWNNVVAVNLTGMFQCCQLAARQMSKGDGGTMVNISSAAGLFAFDNRPAYTATKHGVIGLTKSLAKDLAPMGIRANAICPGLIRSPLTESYFTDEEFVQNLSITIPAGKEGLPRFIANTALFLASPMSEYVSGIAVPVDGAFSASGTFDVSTRDTPYRSTYSTTS